APQPLRLGGIGHTRRIATFDPEGAPPADVDAPLEADRVEEGGGGAVAGGEPELVEALLACLGNRGEEHRPGDALAPLWGGHSKPLVPDQARGVRPESLHPDHA